jgi:hypothetical protein
MALFSNGLTAGHIYGKFKGNVLTKPRLKGATKTNKIGAVSKGLSRGKQQGINSPLQNQNTFNLARCQGHFSAVGHTEQISWSDYGSFISNGILNRKSELLFGLQGYCASCLFLLKFKGVLPLDFSTYSWSGYPDSTVFETFSVSLSPFSFVFKFTDPTRANFAIGIFASAPMSPGITSAFGQMSAITFLNCIHNDTVDIATPYLAIYPQAPQVGQAINFAFYLFDYNIGQQVYLLPYQYVF